MSLSGITILYHRKYKKKGATEAAPVIREVIFAKKTNSL
jgi:hypothetical protein